MHLHQVLTGAVNPGDCCYSVGSVHDVPFTVRNKPARRRVILRLCVSDDQAWRVWMQPVGIITTTTTTTIIILMMLVWVQCAICHPQGYLRCLCPYRSVAGAHTHPCCVSNANSNMHDCMTCYACLQPIASLTHDNNDDMELKGWCWLYLTT